MMRPDQTGESADGMADYRRRCGNTASDRTDIAFFSVDVN